MKRFGFVAPVTMDKLNECREMYAEEKPYLQACMDSADIGNMSVYLGQVDTNSYYTFSYYEYIGDKDAADVEPGANAGEAWHKSDLLARRDRGKWIEMVEVFHFDGDPSPIKNRRRFGCVLGIEEKDILAYTQLHIAVWPQVLKTINDCNLRNFSIFLGEVEKDKYYLFCYYEYVGDDFEADMKRNAQDKVTQVWWTYTEPLQRPVPTRKEGEWWHVMEELAHVK
ncbi:MAG: L-rhamnose mutarotase [Sedimentisphaerales bacterium]|nr:L-rhamnose mutarotase [Sedimentisphaerales bacterium]